LSEAEWEYAARAGSDTAYSWGDEIGNDRANCVGCGRWDKQLPAPVGSFPENAFRLHDMHGNVWEWCEDSWHDNYAGDPPLDGSAWRGGDPFRRAIRGGSWKDSPRFIRSAMRDWMQLDSHTPDVGFRVARTLNH
jgi:formylglycine-generating enzyme required for sulfatase activity